MTDDSPTGIGINHRLIVVSNRLPVVLSKNHGEWDAKAASGGLITALAPALSNRGGTWIGWPGTSEIEGIRPALDDAARDAGYKLEPVRLPEDIVDGYYQGFANEIIWPLFHDVPSRCNFDPAHWQDYQVANEVFAETIIDRTTPGDYIWVHDYHLMLVAEQLRQMQANRSIGFFLHIPFPSVDIFLKLPWRFQILKALLEFDVVGFQTVRDSQNFIQCVSSLMTGVTIRGRSSSHVVEQPGRRTQVGSFPIGIDYEHFNNSARMPEVEKVIHTSQDRLPDITMILGIDRLDYSKGLPERIAAFQNALRRYPDLQGTVTLIQVVIPSREDVPEYQLQRAEVERLVGEVNGEFTQPGWVPIHYLYRSLEPAELFAYYRMSEVCLVTPLKDGMNLVSKEYCACNIEGNGVLILSEFAGSAAQLFHGAIMVNPHDVEGTADAIHSAVHMPLEDRRRRMRRLQEIVKREDIFWWTDSFLAAAFSRRLGEFPVHEYFVPQVDIRDMPAADLEH